MTLLSLTRAVCGLACTGIVAVNHGSYLKACVTNDLHYEPNMDKISYYLEQGKYVNPNDYIECVEKNRFEEARDNFNDAYDDAKKIMEEAEINAGRTYGELEKEYANQNAKRLDLDEEAEKEMKKSEEEFKREAGRELVEEDDKLLDAYEKETEQASETSVETTASTELRQESEQKIEIEEEMEMGM